MIVPQWNPLSCTCFESFGQQSNETWKFNTVSDKFLNFNGTAVAGRSNAINFNWNISTGFYADAYVYIRNCRYKKLGF